MSSKIKPAIDARDIPIDQFYDFNDRKGYTAARARKAVYQHLALHGVKAYPSLRTLSEKLGYTERHIERIISWLQGNGFLITRYKKGPKGTNIHEITLPGHHMSMCNDNAPRHIQAVPRHIEAAPRHIESGTSTYDVVQKRESILEREKQEKNHSFSISDSSRQDVWDEFRVWLARTYPTLSLTSWESQKVKETVLKLPYDLAVFQRAASSILEPLNPSDSYDHAGNRLAAGLESQAMADVQKAKERAEMEKIAEASAKASDEQMRQLLSKFDEPEEVL